MENIIAFLYNLGTSVCHQMPSRTFHFHNNPISVCARCTGTYTGFMFSFIYWMIVNRKMKGGTPPNYALATSVIFILTLVFDGGTSYLHLRETTNEIRLITGLLAGSGAALLIIPCVFELLFKHASREVFTKNLPFFLLWIFLLIIVFFVINTGYYPLYYILTFMISTGIVTMVSMVNAVMLVLLPPWSRMKIENIKTFIYFIIPTLLLTILELYISFTIHINLKELYPI